MRTDTLFNPKYIPLVQGVANITLIKINLQNQHKTKVQYARAIEASKTCWWHITYTNFYVRCFIKYKATWRSFIPSKVFNRCWLSVCCKASDYSYLNRLYLAADTTINSFIDIKDGIVINLVADTLRVNISPAIMQTLSVSYKLWLQNLQHSTDEALIIMTRFVTCNCTNFSLQFGQASFNELILSTSNECYLYSFRSDKLEQKLVFLFESPPPTDPVLIANKVCNIYVLRIVFCYLGQRLFPTQLFFFFSLKGQIEFLSMTREEFRSQCRPNSIKNNSRKKILSISTRNYIRMIWGLAHSNS